MIDVRTLPAVLFSGLADVEHDVVIRAPTAAGQAFWTASDARAVLNVTGVNPGMRVMPVRAQTFDGVFKTASFAIAGPVSRTPAQVSPVRDPNRGPSLASFAFRGSFARLGFVAMLSGGAKHAVFVSVDGGAPTKLTSLSQSVATIDPVIP